MDEKLLKEFDELVNKVKWNFAWTYAVKNLPHEYVVYDKNNETIKKLFSIFKQLAFLYGKTKKRFGREWNYFIRNGFKYWLIEDVLNREWLNGYEIDLENRKFRRL